MTRLLRREIALSPGAAFRGRVANATGRTLPKEKDWRRYSNVDDLALLVTGNYHDGPGLWQDAIPTLMEYGAYKSPAYLVVTRRFFTAPDEIVIRNVVGARHIDQRMLRLLGVRFIITDLPIEGAEERLRLSVPHGSYVPFSATYARAGCDIRLFPWTEKNYLPADAIAAGQAPHRLVWPNGAELYSP
ncbi:MAG: hypothetical protein ACLQJR_03405 [Stellaceae bacterium]